MLTALDHLHFRCVDYEHSARYYVEVMGGRDLGRGDINGWPVWRVELGGQVLALAPPKEGETIDCPVGTRAAGVFQLGCLVDDLAATMDKISAAGGIIEAGPIEMGPKLKVAFVAAPDGVQIELMERG